MPAGIGSVERAVELSGGEGRAGEGRGSADWVGLAVGAGVSGGLKVIGTSVSGGASLGISPLVTGVKASSPPGAGPGSLVGLMAGSPLTTEASGAALDSGVRGVSAITGGRCKLALGEA